MEKRKIDTKLIEEEYMDHSPEEDDMLYWTKEALKQLSPLERKIYITYLELETYTATAKEFKVSVPTLKTYIKNLNAQISDYVCHHLS